MSQQGPLGETNLPGNAVQEQVISSSAFVSTNAIIPFDSTIPQITEGSLLLTLAITPTKATNRLVFNFSTFATTAVVNNATFALFEGAGPNAIWASNEVPGGLNFMIMSSFLFSKIAGTTSPLTYTIRFGALAGIFVYINGNNVGINYGSATSTSLLITEYEV